MLPSPEDDCGDCVPAYLQRRASSVHPLALAFNLSPFILTFTLVATVVFRKLFPVLAGQPPTKDQDERIPSPSYAIKRWTTRLDGIRKLSTRAITASTFSVSIALSAVLAELILCEISNALHPAARSLALNFTLPTLLFLLVLIIPALEIRTVIAATGIDFGSRKKTTARLAWVLELSGVAAWLLCFWWIGKGLLGSYLHDDTGREPHTFSEGCLERVGVIGISLMASLAGFAAVSSLWQTFGARSQPVSEGDIARKQAGLDATNDMISTKKSRLRALQRRVMQDQPSPGFMNRIMTAFQGNDSRSELHALEIEISGLETMALSLSDSLTSLRSRRATQQRKTTPLGRVFTIFSYLFAIYCAYRLSSTLLSTLRRWTSTFLPFISAPSTSAPSPSSSSKFPTTPSTNDPITLTLTLLTRYYSPSIDIPTTTRLLTVALSALMLLAPFNAVLQTVLLVSRLAPSSLLRLIRSNSPLLVGQIAAMYVIAAALLLRSSVPGDVGGVISEALGAPLEPRFVEGWFEGWFLKDEMKGKNCPCLDVTANGGAGSKGFRLQQIDLYSGNDNGWLASSDCLYRTSVQSLREALSLNKSLGHKSALLAYIEMTF
ncbi:hypothetical protein EV356DRAFT_566342 [Viridothelium virens]|uniref:Uncharacterized protein n=1 Tax=Viridothelium virens TaxID=1048519 RepID=A0A6A6HD81_VIRVR|nr:hypothetical protein EV356DRAFT_566342 [Viridothelium virens]